MVYRWVEARKLNNGGRFPGYKFFLASFLLFSWKDKILFLSLDLEL